MLCLAFTVTQRRDHTSSNKEPVVDSPDADFAWGSIVQSLAANDLLRVTELKEGIDTLLVFVRCYVMWNPLRH